MKTPDANHPIRIENQRGHVKVVLAGRVVAETDAALRLSEASYPPVLYIPRANIRDEFFAASERTTHCPYKGDARYFDLVVGEVRRSNAVWSYETPCPAVTAIAGHIAFYPDKVDAIETT